MNDLDLERQLAEAFDAKAEQLVPSRKVPPPLDLDRDPGRPASPHRTRRIWIGTGLVAAAAAVIAGAVAIGGDAVSLRQSPVTPAQQTTPDQVQSPTGSPTVPVTAPPSATSSASSTAPAAPTTHAVTVDGVTVQVPLSWQAAPDDGSSLLSCLTVGGVAQQSSDSGHTGNCELTVELMNGVTGMADPDALGVFGNGPFGCTVTTITADQVTVDGQSAEHRVFTGSCFQGTREQWVVLTAPVVVLSRNVPNASDDEIAAAATAVQGAELPARTSSVRLYDVGIARSVTTSSLALDRVTLMYGQSPVVRDVNPQTYSYALDGNTTIAANGTPVSIAQFRAMIRSGDYSSVGISGTALTEIGTDGTTVQSISLLPAP